MTYPAFDDARAFINANPGNPAIDICVTYGRKMAESLVLHAPEALSLVGFSDQYFDAIRDAVAVEFAPRLRALNDQEADEKVEVLQDVALFASVERLRELRTGGLVGGNA